MGASGPGGKQVDGASMMEMEMAKMEMEIGMENLVSNKCEIRLIDS